MIIERYIDIAGKYRVLVEINSISIPLKYSEEILDELVLIDAERVYNQIIEQQEINSWIPASFNIEDNKELITEFIILIKQNPSVTLTQYNNWLNTKNWNDSSFIRYFVFKLANSLAERNDINLNNKTESIVLGALRNWIVNTSARKLEKIIFNK